MLEERTLESIVDPFVKWVGGERIGTSKNKPKVPVVRPSRRLAALDCGQWIELSPPPEPHLLSAWPPCILSSMPTEALSTLQHGKPWMLIMAECCLVSRSCSSQS
jgi:hypothetical protein